MPLTIQVICFTLLFFRLFDLLEGLFWHHLPAAAIAAAAAYAVITVLVRLMADKSDNTLHADKAPHADITHDVAAVLAFPLALCGAVAVFAAWSSWASPLHNRWFGFHSGLIVASVAFYVLMHAVSARIRESAETD